MLLIALPDTTYGFEGGIKAFFIRSQSLGMPV
jgi:hypothetical protein